jgi:hypothetical protein
MSAPRHFTTLLALALPLLALTACTEVTQSPSDCTESQFFDGGSNLCRTCPPLELSECPDNCGLGLVTDVNGCAEAVCDCEVCTDGQFFDPQDLTCQACPDLALSCAEGCDPVGVARDDQGCQVAACACEPLCNPRTQEDTGTCTPCPAVQVPACDTDVCRLVNAPNSDGCPGLECVCE